MSIKKNKLARRLFLVLVVIISTNFFFFSFSINKVSATNVQKKDLQEKEVQSKDDQTKGMTKLANPLTGEPGKIAPETLFSNIIKFLLSLVGTLSFIAFIIGGTMWLVSGGEADKVKKGKDIFIYASIGLAVVFSSYVVLRFVIQTVTGQ